MLYPAVYVGMLGFQVLQDANWKVKTESTRRFVRNAFIFSTVVYVVFLGAIAYVYWAVALCGFSLLAMAAIAGARFAAQISL